ncbi:hypothetical protein M2352_005033 [Azospirillum fermentarium]|uniref:hypothetical protein n=1 Tax=Azospirillum fermentarium TaxID=1233114 RepID=UPI002225FDF5|nr:hypothetical protein [Azospirillum fermentarium]MCW2249373.1 hypothetical protein [Azospirillum fermentarium]
MDIVGWIAFGLSHAIVPILIAAPLLLYRWVRDTAVHWKAYGAKRVGVVEVSGLLIGICLAATTPLPGGPLTFDTLLMAGGPWDFDAAAFAELAIERVGSAPDRLAGRLIEDDERLNLSLGIGVALLILAVRTTLGFVRSGRRRGCLAAAMDLVIAVMTAVSTLYGVLLTLWLLNRLNFWVLGMAILAAQEYRYNVIGLFHRHRHFRLPRAMLPLGAPVTTGRRITVGGSAHGTGRRSGV